MQAYADWRAQKRHDVAAAMEALQGFNVDIDDLHSVILELDAREEHSFYPIIFLNAGYAQSRQPVIIYDLDLPEHRGIGGFCPHLLINRGTAGEDFGSGAKGVIINQGRVMSDPRRQLRGLYFNDGMTGRSSKLKRYVIHGGDPPSFPPAVLYRDQYPLGFEEHTAKLLADCRGPIDQILAQYGPTPADTIKAQVGRFLWLRQ
jgi:hypothetical protein